MVHEMYGQEKNWLACKVILLHTRWAVLSCDLGKNLWAATCRADCFEQRISGSPIEALTGFVADMW